VKNDAAKQLHDYVRALRKQGGRLIVPSPVRSSKDVKRQKEAIKAELNKSSN
jgi:hypothetical protein